MGDRSGMTGPPDCRMWLGSLHKGTEAEEIWSEAKRYGKVTDVRVRSSRTDTFAFVQFQDRRGMERAIEELHGSTRTRLGDRLNAAVATADTKNQGPPRRRSYSREGQHSRGNDRRDWGSQGGSGGRDKDWSDKERRDWDRDGHRSDREFSRNNRPRSRSRSLQRLKKSIPQGKYKITVENLPSDMAWMELKEIGKEFGGPSLTFSRTFRQDGRNNGIVEFSDRRDAENLRKELDGRKVQGCANRLRAYVGGD